MGDKTTKGAMGAVLEDMGRAAREGRARRFNRKRGDMGRADVEVDPVKESMSNEDMDELTKGLEVQR